MSRGPEIHPSAVVEPGAELGSNVRIGPFCHVGTDVVLGNRVELVAHVTIMGATTIGDGTKIYPQAVLGGPPQNLKHKGGRTTLTVGRNSVVRECATLQVGTDTSHGATVVGDNAFLMAYTHVAHDCVLGDNVTMANYAALAGHVEVGDSVTFGGFAGVHQFVRIGHHAFIAGSAGVVGDVVPYGMAFGNRAYLRGLNVVGLKRSGMRRDQIAAIRQAYRVLFDESTPLAENAQAAREQFAHSEVVIDMIDFILSRGKRHFTVPERGAAQNADDGRD